MALCYITWVVQIGAGINEGNLEYRGALYALLDL